MVPLWSLVKLRANPAVKRTLTGMPPPGLTSFWPGVVPPARAAYGKRQTSIDDYGALASIQVGGRDVSNLQVASTAIQSLAAPGMLVAMFFGADSLLGKDASKALSDAIDDVSKNPNDSRAAKAFEKFLDDNFSPKNGVGGFLSSVFLLTVFSLLFFLALYTARMSNLFDQLLTKGFLTQFIGNGLVITFAINCYVFSQYKNLLSVFARASIGRSILWILSDICVKCILFIGLTTLIYVIFALTTNAFHGSATAAIKAAPVTIWNALFFENLTSVYLYSLLLSSVPVYLVVIIKLMIHNESFYKIVQRTLFLLPIKEKPIRAAACVFAGLLALFGLTVAAMVTPLT
jgi:hypothetical protein